MVPISYTVQQFEHFAHETFSRLSAFVNFLLCRRLETCNVESPQPDTRSFGIAMDCCCGPFCAWQYLCTREDENDHSQRLSSTSSDNLLDINPVLTLARNFVRLMYESCVQANDAPTDLQLSPRNRSKTWWHDRVPQFSDSEYILAHQIAFTSIDVSQSQKHLNQSQSTNALGSAYSYIKREIIRVNSQNYWEQLWRKVLGHALPAMLQHEAFRFSHRWNNANTQCSKCQHCPNKQNTSVFPNIYTSRVCAYWKA